VEKEQGVNGKSGVRMEGGEESHCSFKETSRSSSLNNKLNKKRQKKTQEEEGCFIFLFSDKVLRRCARRHLDLVLDLERWRRKEVLWKPQRTFKSRPLVEGESQKTFSQILG